VRSGQGTSEESHERGGSAAGDGQFPRRRRGGDDRAEQARGAQRLEQQLGEDLLAALRHAGAEEGVRAIVITGAGRAFSSGADLKDVSGGDTTPEGRPDVHKTLTERYHPIMHAIRAVPKPVIAAVTARPSASAARWPCAAI